MVNVIICDRCSKVLGRFTTGLVNIDISREVTCRFFSSYTKKENLHLCNACYDAFGKFLCNEQSDEVEVAREE